MSLIPEIYSFSDKKEIVLRITKVCNQKCLFCFTDIDNKTEIDYEDIIYEIDKIIDNNKDSLLDFVLTGGEPTTHKDFIKIVKYIYKKDKFITIQTNAVNFNSNLIEKLKKYKSKISFFISYHSHQAKIYDITTNTKGQFLIATNGIKNIINNFDKVIINIVINKFNLNYLISYFDFIGKNYYNINNKLRINLSVMSSVVSDINKSKYIDKLMVKYTDIVDMINKSEKIIKFYDIKIGNDFGGPSDLPYCIGRNLFYYKDSLDGCIEEVDNNIKRNKTEKCNGCKFINNCSGILDIYKEKYGDDEFNAVLVGKNNA